MTTRGIINSNFYQIVNVDADGNPTDVKQQYIPNASNANSANFANYANVAGTAYNVSVANVSGIGNIATINLDGNSGNILYGNGIFSAAPNVQQANSANYANYSNFANVAYHVTGSNVSGTVANANYASYSGNSYSVNVANVVGIGNIATINLDGNSGNILYGNGIFSAAPNVNQANNANYANYSNFAGVAYSVSGANVTGTVANATYALNAGNAYNVSGSNVSGTVANANYASYAGNAFSVSGSNVIGTVANATYALNAGNAYNVSGSNVSGQVANALVAGTVYTNAQPNITSLGTLSGLTSSGNISAPYFLGNVVGNISGNIVVPGTQWDVLYNDSGNAGASDNLKFNATSNLLTVVGNVSANYYIGNGSALTSLTGGNVTGIVANANYASYAGNVLSNVANANYSNFAGTAYNVSGSNVTGQVANALIAGTVYTNSQPNITSVGTLTSLNVTGNVTSGNVIGGNLVSANYISGNGSLLSNITGANVNGFVPNANVANTAYSVSGSNVSGQVANALVSGTVYTNAQPNITSVGTLSSLNVSSNITTGNLNGANLITSNYFSGNGSLLSSITGGNVTGQVANALIAGTVYTASQPNITSVGTLTSLSVSGNITSGNISGGNLVSANYLSGNAHLVSGLALGDSNFTDVLITSPTNGQYLGYNGVNWVNSTISQTTSTSAGVNFWVTTPVITPATTTNLIQIDTLNTTPNTSSVLYTTTPVVNTTAAVVAVVSSPLQRTQFDAGNWEFSIWANANSSGGTTTVEPAVYQVNPGSGTITITGAGTTRTATASLDAPFANSVGSANVQQCSWLQTPNGLYQISNKTSSTVVTITVPATYVNESSVNYFVWDQYFVLSPQNISTTLTEYVFQTTQSTLPVQNTTRLGYITIGSSTASHSITVTYNGSTTSTHFSTPFITLHDSLAGLQGGQTLEYYHLTNSEYTGTGSGTFVRQISPQLTTPNIDNATGTTLQLSGNLSAGNINGANLVTSNYFSGNGSLLTNVTGGNVSGQVGNALVAGTVYTNAQPNITSVGTLTSLTIGGNIIPNANVTYNLGNSTNRFKDIYLSGNSIVLGTQTISSNSSGISMSGTLSGDAGNLSNITGANVTGQVSNSAIAGTVYTNAQPNITSVGTLSSLSVTANITSGNATLGNLTTSNYFSGNGSLLTSITGANVTGTVSSATTAGTVTTASQPNITSVGTLSSLSVTGNISTSNYLLGNGYYITGLPASYGNSDVANYLPTFTGNLKAGNANLGNLVTANYFSGNGSLLTGITATTATTAGTVTTNAQPNITSVGTLSSLTVSGDINGSRLINGNSYINITANSNIDFVSRGVSKLTLSNTTVDFWNGNVTAIGNATVSNNLIAGNVYANTGIVKGQYLYGDGSNITNVVAISATTAGTVTTNAQPNITSVGTLSSLNVTGNFNAGNISSNNNFYANSGNIYANLGSIRGQYLYGDGGNITGITAATAQTVTTNAQPNITSVGSLTGLTLTANSNIAMSGSLSQIAGSNLVSASYLTGTLTTASQPNITSVGTLSNLTITSNGNITMSGSISQLSGANLISGSYLTGTLTTASQPNITSVGSLTSLNTGTVTLSANSNIAMSGSLSQIAGGNLVSASYLTGTLTTASQPNITSVGTLTSLTSGTHTLSANSNIVMSGSQSQITGANLISGNYVSGNGSLLTSITGGNVTGQVSNALIAGTVYTNAQPNITSVGNLSSLTINGNVTGSNSISLYGNGGVMTANISVTNYYTSTTNNFNFGFAQSRGTRGTPSAAQAGDDIFAFTTAVYTGNGSGTWDSVTGWKQLFPLRNTITSQPSVANGWYGSNITFRTTNSVTNLPYVTSIDESGNLTSPGLITANGLTSTGNVNFTSSSNTSLGPLANIKITGGSSGYVLSTDGLGNLSWVAQTGGGGSTATDFTASFLLGGM